MAAAFVGLISGTSMDGIDAVVADFTTHPPVVRAARTHPFSQSVKQQLERVQDDPDHYPAADLARLDAELGEAIAEAANAIIAEARIEASHIAAIGSHGQTIVHHPDAKPAHTLQIGDPARIAQRTGIITVADFRRADLAAGGQGAPLAPLLHRALLHDPKESRAVVNLGGIANVTLLPASGAVAGFDTGPANCFLDYWYRKHHADAFDPDGQWAAGGAVLPDFLGSMLEEPYFSRPPPKSTGIEYFSPKWLEQRLPADAHQRARDIQATLAELTATSLARNLTGIAGFRPDRILVCGGGVHNTDLIARIRAQFPQVPVQSTADYGLDPDFIEALLFAWLARERLVGRPVDTGPITGASRPVLAGVVFEPG